jgi:hypothetical protein
MDGVLDTQKVPMRQSLSKSRQHFAAAKTLNCRSNRHGQAKTLLNTLKIFFHKK